MNEVNKIRQVAELKKHINAIHCTNNLTLVQRKLLNALLYNAYPDLPHKSQYEIPARSLCSLIGYNSNDYAKLRKALLGLMSVAIEWNVIDQSTPDAVSSWRASSALAAAKLEGGICTYEYSGMMRELLYRPEMYGRLNIAVLAKFKSSYGIALYENCIRFQGLAQTPWFGVDIFKKLMGVHGTKYELFTNFKKRVLNPAVTEVNEHSPITLSPEIKRINQKVVSIRFKLANKTADPITQTMHSPQNDQEKIVDILTSVFGLSAEITQDILTKYDLSYLQEKTDLIINSESFRAGKIRALAGYLIDALKRDYKTSKSSKEIIKEQQSEQEYTERLARDKQDNLRQQYNQYEQLIIHNYLSTLDVSERDSLNNAFIKHLQNEHALAYSWFRKYGLEHPGVSALLTLFIKHRDAEKVGSILSYNEFTEQHSR